MSRPLRIVVAAVTCSLAVPALAHVDVVAALHVHDGDGWGLLAVVALTALAAWLDRRWR